MLDIDALATFSKKGYALDFGNNMKMEASIKSACSKIPDEETGEIPEGLDAERRELNMLIALQKIEIGPDFDPDKAEHSQKLFGDDLPRMLNAAWDAYVVGGG
jgi:hypothetical protein